MRRNPTPKTTATITRIGNACPLLLTIGIVVNGIDIIITVSEKQFSPYIWKFIEAY